VPGPKLPSFWIVASAAQFATLVALCPPVTAGTIWTDWTSAVAGDPGTASGTLNGIAVSYAGEVLTQTITNGSFTGWAPASSFQGGTVTTSPAAIGDMIAQNGYRYAGPDTITFAAPVVNPVIAIWSLGSSATQASMTFSATPTFEGGGPDSMYGGSRITLSGNVVSGKEGNGVVQFTGTFRSISWTETFENYYGFTVGMTQVAEPAPLALLAVPFALLCAIKRGSPRRRRNSATDASL
jgi:hypothetical protein